METGKTLILGLGNEILTDDSIGIRLAKDLNETEIGKLVTIKTASCGGLEILEIIDGFERVIILDSVHTGCGNPGDTYLFKPSDFKETSHLTSLHDTGFLQALELAKKLGLRIPGRIHIFAVEVFEDRKFGTGLSPVLEKKYQEIFEKAFAEVRKLIS